MDIKKIFTDNWFGIICMVICFGLGFVLGALLAPHHNRLEFNLFSGNGNDNGSDNGNDNRDNSASFGSGGISGKKTDKNRKSKRS